MIVGLVPAAGTSSRMGRPKLPMLVGGRPLIERVVSALRLGGADRVVVIVPPVDVEGSIEMATIADRAGAEVVALGSPSLDMRETFLAGLFVIRRKAIPSAILLTPGDCPNIDAKLVARLVELAREAPDRIIAPAYAGRRGHPIVLPWALAEQAGGLEPGVGINTLIERHAGLVSEVPVDDPDLHADIDTPEDLARWNAGR